ncbi:MAG: hypothetical protein KOO65_01205 [Desulfobacterales bacterium]|nr:hypothetical protein [Desulfobacterales bacterium]MBU8909862.1 hypothetical protein [Desulfobacterales bacterium]
MEEKPLKSVFFHFRFKFLAITAIFFLVWIILTGSAEFDQFTTTLQFKLLGPFFIGSGFFYLIFRKVPFKCPNCDKFVSTRKDWHCPDCGKMQGRERYLSDKCIHCKQMLATSFCDHCKEEFRL